jgi:signal recognition particle subunit SRP54
MRAVTGKPIKLVRVGEKMDALEEFYPERVANRILGMGDIVSLVEKASETIDAEKAQAMAKKMAKGIFTLDDLADQLKQMQKMGGMGAMMGLVPGMGKMAKQMANAKLDDNMFKRQQAIISSMTKKERQAPKLLNASRKKRIASGSGTKVEEINKLLKMHRQMADMMKMMKNKKGGLMGGLGGLLGGGGMPELPPGVDINDPKTIEALSKGQLPPGMEMPKLPGGLGGLGGLGGMGGGGFGGLPGLGGKKKR